MKKTWYKIFESIHEISFSPNGLTEIEVNGKRICLARFQNELFACTAKCPHASGILAEGYIDPLGNIVCPLHRYKYNLENGRNVSGEGFFLKTYKLVANEEGVFLEVDS